MFSALLFEHEKHDAPRSAVLLKSFVSENFVVVHIENQCSPNGYEVLELTSAENHYDEHLPFIFTVDKNGKFASILKTEQSEIRCDTSNWYRGYDRKKLLKILKDLRGI